MVRRCIVRNCKNIDTEILSHRFPKSPEQSKKWIESLQITDRTNDELAKCFVVCTIHFDKKDYRNELSNKLNSTAIPKLIGHTPRVSSKIITSPDDITPCLEDDETDNNPTIDMDSNSIQIIQPNLIIPITSQQQKISQIDLTPSDATISDSHEILNISMESSILMYELTDSSNKHLIQYAEDDSQKTDCGGEQNYESDVEVIDMNEIKEDLEQQQHQFKLDNISGTVSFISSGGNTSPIYFDIFDKNVTDHSCQVDTDELLKNFENNINNDGDDDIHCDDDEYQDMDRKQLIELIKEQKRKINEMDIKLKEFQKAHSKLVKSMDAFKMLIGSES